MSVFLPSIYISPKKGCIFLHWEYYGFSIELIHIIKTGNLCIVYLCLSICTQLSCLPNFPCLFIFPVVLLARIKNHSHGLQNLNLLYVYVRTYDACFIIYVYMTEVNSERQRRIIREERYVLIV